ncbi:MAG: 5,10-methylenetetrahydrofolate reductase [Euryarchaeota archaeon]|nr:5,10-methylenetetrahydrofolate reductase [Euryarchaeota archaeon]
MIHTRHKPLEEILQMLSGAKVALLGCGGCVAFYRTGGAAQVRELAEKLRGHAEVVALGVSNRQCYLCAEEELSGLSDAERIRKIARELEGFDRLEEAEAVLSLACGVGVQNLAGVLEMPVYPAQNTLFMGRRRVEGDIDIELCAGCGDCVLGYTAGICPVTRCSKSLMNGPCGGVFNGLCEVSRVAGEEIPCAWVEIYRRLKKLGRLQEMRRIREAKSHSSSGIPRRVKVQEGVE